MTKQFNHITVLLEELVTSLSIQAGHTVVDCTAGGGGHTALLLNATGPTGKVIALDQDDDAIAHLSNRFANELASGQLILVKKNFRYIETVIKNLVPTGKVDGICADLGVSSHQLDLAERGFSFRKDAQLDMRMDRESFISAREYINSVPFTELVKVLYEYGEEPKAKFIAQAIIRSRESAPIETTDQLATIIRGAVHYKKPSRTDPATRSFQAIRMAINEELQSLTTLLENGPDLLTVGGRMALISFHSLEDRLVKHAFQKLAGKKQDSSVLRKLPITTSQGAPFGIVKPFPILPSANEIEVNPRSRSAKLRVIEKYF